LLLWGRPVSIDIGSYSVKVAQLRYSRGGVRGIRCAEEPLPAGFHWEPGRDNWPLVAAVRAAMAKAGIRSRTAVMSLPRRHVTARISAFPPAERTQLRRVVEYDLADHIPFPVDQVVMDLQALGPSRDQPGLTDVLVVAAQREFVRQYLDLAKQLGLRLVALTVDSLALHDLVSRSGLPSPAGLTLTVEMGHHAATINVSQDGRLWLTRSVPVGGQQLTAAIRDDLGLSSEQAEAKKIAEGLQVLERQPRPDRAAAWLGNLCGELRRSALSFGQAAVGRIFLLGPGAQVPGLGEAIGREFGVAPVALSAWDLFPQARLRDDTGAVSSCLLAIGQALQGIGRSAWAISLVPRELIQRRRARRLRAAAAGAGVLVIGAFSAWYVVSARAVEQLQIDKGRLQKSKQVADQQQQQVGQLLETRDRLRDQVSTLLVVRRHRHAALEVLRTVAEAGSPEVRVLAFQMAASGGDESLVIRGNAPDTGAVADLQDALAQSPLVTEVSVENATRSFERPARSAGARADRRRPAEETRPSESVSFVIKARLWSKPKERLQSATLARPAGAK